MKIVETITDDFVLNNEIEEKLAHYSGDDKNKLLDGLEIIYNAGPSGIAVREWVPAMKSVWSDINNEEAKRIFKLILGEFTSLITRNEGQYIWTRPSHTDDEIDANDPTTQMAKVQIQATFRIQQLMKEANRFTPDAIARQFVQEFPVPTAMAQMMVQHTIDQSLAFVKSNGDGTYSWHEPVAANTGLSFLRDLEGYEEKPKPDVKLHHIGSMIGFEILSDAAHAFISNNVHTEEYQWDSNIVHVEARYAPDIVEGMEDEGLVVEKLG